MKSSWKSFIVPFLIVALLAILFFIGCDEMNTKNEFLSGEPARNAEVMKFFSGNHDIRRLVPRENNSYSSRLGGFFLFGTGGISGSGSTTSIPSVTFAWQNFSDSSFVFSTIPLSRVRVKIVETIEAPMVNFSIVDPSRWASWNKYPYFEMVKGWNKVQPDEVLQDILLFVTITTRSEYWPVKVEIP